MISLSHLLVKRGACVTLTPSARHRYDFYPGLTGHVLGQVLGTHWDGIGQKLLRLFRMRAFYRNFDDERGVFIIGSHQILSIVVDGFGG